jgi:uncharacterized repeat protein (TIGR01451 family)
MRRVTGSTIAVMLLLGLAGVLPPTASAAIADLVVTKQALNERVEPGDSVEYEISVENTTATDITVDAVTDNLPNGFSYEPGSTAGMSQSDPFDVDGTLEWPVDYLVPAGAAHLLSFRATAAEATGSYFNSADALASGHTVEGSGQTAEVVVDFPPLELLAKGADGGVELDWKSSHRDAETFRLFYTEGQTPPDVGEGTEVPLEPEQTFAYVGGLDNGTTYAFSLFSFVGDRQVQSAEATATPMLPGVENLRERGAGDDAVQLSWRNPDGISDVVVRSATSGWPAGPNDGTGAPVPSREQSVRITGLTSGTTYYFSVFATRDGAYSEPATAAFAPYRCSDLSQALDAPAGLVTGSTWVECAGPGAHSNASIQPTVLPRTGPQALMTTGDTAVADYPSDGGEEGVDLGASSRGAFDVSTYRLDLDVPEGAECLTFDYVFATEEYPEFVDSRLSDGFIAELDGTSWQVNRDGVEGELDAPDNVAATADGDYVSVHSAPFADIEQVMAPAQSNTGYDGASRPLRATIPVTPGEHELYLSIFDGGDDGLVDSAVFLDRLRVLGTPCSAGTQLSPKAVDDEAQTVATAPVTTNVLTNDLDPQGEALTLTGRTNGSRGAVTCNAASCTYTAQAGFAGTDRYTYTVTNSVGLTGTGTVTVAVAPPPNRAPVATDDNGGTVRAGTSTTIAVLANDTDPDGDPLRITARTNGAKGTVSCTTTQCTYAAAAGASGPDSFTYTVSDGRGGTDTATVRVTVEPAPAPVATGVSIAADAARVLWPGPVSLSGTVTGSDGTGMAGQRVTLWALPAGGSWTQVGAVTSGAGGAVTLTHRPVRATAYQWRTPGLTSTQVSVAVKPVLTAKAPAKVKRKRNLVVKGASTPVDAGDTVLLQRKVKKRWTTVATKRFRVESVATSGGTAYKLTTTMKTVGKQAFRVRLPAQSGRLAVNGKAFVVKVTRR